MLGSLPFTVPNSHRAKMEGCEMGFQQNERHRELKEQIVAEIRDGAGINVDQLADRLATLTQRLDDVDNLLDRLAGVLRPGSSGW